MIPFIPMLIGAGIGAGISEATGGEWEQGAMYGAAGGAFLGGGGALPSGSIETGAGIAKGAGTALFGGGEATTGLTIGQSMAAIAEPGYYDGEVGGGLGGLFDSLGWDTIGNVASLGYQAYTSSEQRKLAEKAIEAQRGAGYVVIPGAPGQPATTLAPSTSVVLPAAAAAAKELDTKVMIKYAIIALIAYFLFKGFK